MEPNQKLIAKKEEWAKFKRGLSEDGVMQDHRPRGTDSHRASTSRKGGRFSTSASTRTSRLISGRCQSAGS